MAALVALDRAELDPAVVDETLGILLKNQEDLQTVRGDKGAHLAELVERVRENVETQRPQRPQRSHKRTETDSLRSQRALR